MPLTVRDVRGLDQELVSTGARASSSREETLRAAATWFEAEGGASRILDRGMFAHLCEFVRSAFDDDVRSLALGALISLERDWQSDPERARFIVRFALRRLCARTGSNFQWGGVSLPENELRDAEVLFEVALGDSERSDDDLVDHALRFADDHHDGGDLFSRFSQDLELLVEVLTNPGAVEEHGDVARAALLYFLEVADAIPDDLGPVGLLDDAFVVRRAVERIFPGRSVLSGYLDAVVHDWPFVMDVVLEQDEEARPLSEFVVINAALLLTRADGSKEDEIEPTAIVAADAGPLPFLMGFIRALAEVRSFVHEPGIADFEIGDRLSDKSSGAEVVFQGFGRFVGTRFEACSANEATHFRASHPGKKAGGDVMRTKSIADLAALQRSTKEAGRLKSGIATIDQAGATIGPLERTFGTLQPIALPGNRRRVVVVSPVKASRGLAETVTFHGARLIDVIPMGQARLTDDDLVSRRWTKEGAGGPHMLTVVRTSAEALELVEEDEQETLAVVAGVRPGSTDAANLRRIAADGVPVLAVVEERDEDGQETLRAGEFNFWAWDEEWLRHLRWPAQASPKSNHPVANYERQYRARVAAKVTVRELELPGLDEARSSLEKLDRLARTREDESMDIAVGSGFQALVQLCRACVDSLDRPAKSLESYRAHLETSSRWWSDDAVGAGEAALRALDSALASLRDKNPKRELLDQWARENEDGSVAAPAFIREAAAEVDDIADLNWVAASGRSAISGPLLIPAWLGKGTMERLLVPPASSEVTLALYGPERVWHRALDRRRARGQKRIRQLVQDRPTSLSKGRTPPPDPYSVSTPEAPVVEEPLVDDVIDRVRRARVLRDLGSASGDELVEARLVYFSGGAWAPMGPHHAVNTVTHLIGSRDAGEEEALREIPASELRAGDVVVLVRESGHDAIRHAADSDLPAGAREAAAIWHGAINRFLAAGRTLNELKSKLDQVGCHRTIQTLRGWANNERIIGPKDSHLGTVRHIQKATGDVELRERLSECEAAIHTVRSAHMSAAARLAKQVLESAREWLDAETRPDELVEVEDRLVMLTVETIDSELATVPRSALNRLHEESV